MTVAVAETEDGRRETAGVDEWIGRLQREIDEEASAGAIDAEGLARLSKAIRDAARRISSEVVPEIDAPAANQVDQRLISMLTLDLDETSPLDAADHYLLGLETVRHIVRDALDEQRPEALRRRADEIIAMLEAWLPSAGVVELAELLGGSVRQLQRRRSADRPASAREQLVARLVATLRHSWTDAGVVAWFHRPRADLDGAAPIERLGDPAFERELLMAAKSGRAQGGV